MRRLDNSSERSLARARSLANLLDSSIPIPGTRRRIGLDPILGLVPFVGDFAGALLSGYIVLAAARAGLPILGLLRMIANVAIDTLAGSVPILGDVFDAAWKSNVMNVALFEKHLAGNSAAARSSRSSRSSREIYRLGVMVLVVSAIVLLALLTLGMWLAYVLLRKALAGH